MKVDLNADLGESAERLGDGSDAELMRYITSANVACGAHAGDAAIMEQTLELALRFGVSVGAHPSYPDRTNFGRIAMKIDPAGLTAAVHAQLTELKAISDRVGIPITHVKPHGALYHACNSDAEVARAVCRAVLAIDSRWIMLGQAGTHCLDIYRDMGLPTAAEAFADRMYEADGSLRDRKLPGGVHSEESRAVQQAIDIATRNTVRTFDGRNIDIHADSLCLHSDTPGAARFARLIREKLAAVGVQVAPLGPRR